MRAKAAHERRMQDEQFKLGIAELDAKRRERDLCVRLTAEGASPRGIAYRLQVIDEFRTALPPHRRGWFDGLSDDDQFRLMRDTYDVRPISHSNRGDAEEYEGEGLDRGTDQRGFNLP